MIHDAAAYEDLKRIMYAADFLSVAEAALILRVSENEAADLLHLYWSDHPEAAAREKLRRSRRIAERFGWIFR